MSLGGDGDENGRNGGGPRKPFSNGPDGRPAEATPAPDGTDIAAALHQLYDPVLDEPVPDRLLTLLERLRSGQ